MTHKTLIIAIILFLIPVFAGSKDKTGRTGQDDRDTVDLGFRKADRESVLSSVSSMNVAERFSEDRWNDTESYIDGLLPGLRSGSNIRGISKALYVIDGVPGRDVTQVSPEEIESVSVLRDANAVALYGSQGADGVIVITTKRGKIQKNKITVNADYGIDLPVALPEYLSSSEYMTLYDEARRNDGLAPMYGQELIDLYASGANPYKYPDFDFYSSDFIRPLRSRAGITAEFTGGDDKLRYYVNLKYNYLGTIEKINPDSDRGAHRYQVRANLDFRINSFITSSVDVMVSMSSDRNASSSLMTTANTVRPNLYAPLIPVEYLSDELRASEFMNTVKVYDGYILGGSSSYKDLAPIADMIAGGYVRQVDRNTQVSNSLDFDLSGITEGLYARTFIGFDYYDWYNLSVNNKYNFYEPVWDGDKVISLTALGEDDIKDQVENVSVRDFTLRLGGNVQVGYDRTFAGSHNVSAMFIASSYMTKPRNEIQENVDSYLALDVNYNWKHRYFVNLTGSYLNSTKLAPGHRGGFSPVLSVGYVLTNEPFMKNAGFLDYLKIKASFASLKSDKSIDQYYLYQDFYSLSGNGNYQWNDGASSLPVTSIINGRNLNLTYLDKRDISAGFEAEFFNSLGVEAIYYRSVQEGFVKRSGVTYPSFYEDFTPYYNDGIKEYQGTEIAVNYRKMFGDFSLNAGINFVYSTGKVKEVDEVPYEYDYLSDVGESVNMIRGLVADGLYQKSDFVDGELRNDLPVPMFGEVQPGDIKYEDINEDGVIDANDKKVIGTELSPVSLGINFLLKYRNFSLFVLGRGMIGGNGILNHSTYYWADGDDKYSNIVLGRWNEANQENATFPRLTTQSSSHNYQNSSYWIYDKSYFDLARVQFTYSLPKALMRKSGIDAMEISITGNNLVKFAKNKEYLELNIGGEPMYRSILLGFRMSF